MPQERDLSALRLQRTEDESLIRLFDFEGSPKKIRDDAGNTLVMLNREERSVEVSRRSC